MINRYTRPEMGSIWEDENRYAKWLDVEIAACEAMSEEGIIPAKDLKVIKEKAGFSVERIMEIEEETKHDVIAFLTNVAEYVGPESRFIHLGLTSSDILDTSFALLLKEAMNLIIEDVERFMKTLKKRAIEHKHTVMIGRSHGIHAEPITFGLKLAVWYSEMERNLRRLEDALNIISYGKLSGAVGTFANISPRVEELTCKKLGLTPAEISTQIIQRDRHAQYFTALAILAGTLEKIAVEIRHLQRTEVLEAEEPFKKGQKGSSAMPHKKNPIGSENISGLARLVRSNSLAAMENIALFDNLQRSNVKLLQAYDATIEGWAQALELRDMEIEGHSRRAVTLTMDLAKLLGIREEEMIHIRRGALLHDIGKMGVSDAILQNSGELTDEEWQIMRQHPVYAYDWLASIDYLRPALDIPYFHHEKWDGSGYPRGLKGEQIPLAARIFSNISLVKASLPCDEV